MQMTKKTETHLANGILEDGSRKSDPRRFNAVFVRPRQLHIAAARIVNFVHAFTALATEIKNDHDKGELVVGRSDH